MSHLTEEHRFVLREIYPSVLKDFPERVCDLGCGRGVWGYLTRFILSSYRPDKEAYLIGVDIHRPYLEFVRKYKVYDDIILASVTQLPFKDKSINVILTIELIEHLSKDEGLVFLDEVERVCTDKIVLTTPNGFWSRKGSLDIPPEVHRSGWHVKDFKKRGYKIHGMGFKYVKFYTRYPFLWGILFYIFTPLSYVIPRLGEILMATKEIQ